MKWFVVAAVVVVIVGLLVLDWRSSRKPLPKSGDRRGLSKTDHETHAAQHLRNERNNSQGQGLGGM